MQVWPTFLLKLVRWFDDLCRLISVRDGRPAPPREKRAAPPRKKASLAPPRKNWQNLQGGAGQSLFESLEN